MEDDEKLLKHDVLLTEDRFGGGKHSIAILDALNEAFFQDMGFRGNTANYYNPANSFIDKVLENRQGVLFFFFFFSFSFSFIYFS